MNLHLLFTREYLVNVFIPCHGRGINNLLIDNDNRPFKGRVGGRRSVEKASAFEEKAVVPN